MASAAVTVLQGDFPELMTGLAPDSVHSIVTDPAHGLQLDGPPPGITWARECLRVLRPGGHLVAFGSARTGHRLAVAVEDAGFEIRDTIAWLYARGLPESVDVEAAAAGGSTAHCLAGDRAGRGWGTGLKPAFEPIVVARKPLVGTVAANLRAHDTGAINVDGCRIRFASALDERESKDKNRHGDFGTPAGGNTVYGDFSMCAERGNYDAPGRWPANVVLAHREACEVDDTDPTPLGGHGRETGREPAVAGRLLPRAFRCAPGCQVAELDVQSGTTRTGRGKPRSAPPGGGNRMTATGASRFFFCAKAGRAERVTVDGVTYPTVRSLALMRWLVRLVTPAGGVVLDPFAGSGLTAEACLLEGMHCIAMERPAE